MQTHHGGIVRIVSAGPATGLVTLLTLLAALAATAGLGGAGWAAGIGCGVLGTAALAGAPRTTRLGPADWVTLSRAVLAGGVAALTADSFARPVFVPVMVALATVALLLDAVDGRVARRTGTMSAFGARFDLEVDAFLILVLSCYVARSTGTWVLLIGLARYALVAAGWMLVWLCEPAPPRYWCKVVAAAQGVVLTLAAADVAPRSLTFACLVAAAVLLAESFGREVWWKWRQHARSAPDLQCGRIVVTLLGEQVRAG
jgi:phosphatidylglycerophosphate synthase